MFFWAGDGQAIYANLALYNLSVLPCQSGSLLPSPKPTNYAQLGHSLVSELITFKRWQSFTLLLKSPVSFFATASSALRCTSEVPAFYDTCKERAHGWLSPVQNCFLGWHTLAVAVFCLGITAVQLAMVCFFLEQNSCSCILLLPNFNYGEAALKVMLPIYFHGNDNNDIVTLCE